ncbi:hypothetical protein CHS0354_021323 [Potamilus streckersoni]|uniref:adenosine deaminase n=1 Tax=Potamilus streckersoni TaxID=2493646 RepID=A0AAE0TLT5_9BIVA|nr:hypothetical protein CHS0354_021323 [Potamilus streckersoni]
MEIDNNYTKNRQEMIEKEYLTRIGGELVLTQTEEKVNQILMAAKGKEINDSFYNGVPFPPQLHFFKAKPAMENSTVFQFIKKMPKGGALHLHDCSMTDLRWLVKNATYMNSCYMCYDQDKKINFHFFRSPPEQPGCQWHPVSFYRNQSTNISAFDDMLYQSMSLEVTDPHTSYPTLDAVWKKFEEVLIRANGLINYAPVFAAYYYEALKEFMEDNVQYLEVRALLPEVYDLDGKTYMPVQVMEIYRNTTVKFVQDNPSFTGAKVIKSNIRFKTPAIIKSDIIASAEMMSQFPDHFAGYDLVGQEDPGKPLLYYLDALLYPSSHKPPINLPYFFHAGETDWEGTSTDYNLIDAILLNTTRIGHGYALPKHSEAMKMVKKQQIAVEVNPISNQVLKLVDDLRNHPAAILFEQGFPVVISADDPAVWGAKGLSYDFYEAFMGLAGKDADLKLLKQLAMNSLMYSAMSTKEKVQALDLWSTKWQTFINSTLEEYVRNNNLKTGLVFTHKLQDEIVGRK